MAVSVLPSLGDALVTITVPANALGANGTLRIYTVWTCTNNANAKTSRIRFSGASGSLYHVRDMASSTSWRFWAHFGNAGATNSQKGESWGLSAAGGVTQTIGVTSAVDTTAATTVVISLQKGTAGDTVTLESYSVEIIRP